MNRKEFATGFTTLADQRQVVVNVSSANPDRAGDVVVQSGVDYAGFMALGGTVLWTHDARSPIAKAVEMNLIAGKLRARVQFPPPGASAKSDEVYALIRAGIVNAASIGFNPVQSEPINPREPFGPQRFIRTELIEFSFVSLPCNRDAKIVERAYGKSGRVLSGANRAELARLRRHLRRAEARHDDAMDSLDAVSDHLEAADRHAAALAASAGDDGDRLADGELSARFGMTRSAWGDSETDRFEHEAGRRRRGLELIKLAVRPENDFDRSVARRQRELEVIKLANPQDPKADAAAARRRREIELLRLSAPR